MGLISDLITSRLNDGKNYHCIVTGLDRSGKTTMIKNLINKFTYVKYFINLGEGYTYPWDYMIQYQVFDRSPLTDLYAYTNLNSDDEDRLWYVEKCYLDQHIHKFVKPMFVIYLHNLWDNGDQIPEIYANLDKIKNRFIRIVKYLKDNGYYIIVCTEKSIRQYNLQWESDKTKSVSLVNEWGTVFKY